MTLHFKNFTTLNDKEIRLVYDMRNSEEIRLKMYNQEIIPFENHVTWVHNLKSRNDCLYFLVYSDSKVLGVIDYTSITKEDCEWGYYLDPQLNASGYGVLLEYYVIKYAFENLKIQKLYCAVLDSNKSVENMHKNYFHFSSDEKYTTRKTINNEKLIFNGLSITKNEWKNWNSDFVNKTISFFKVENIIWN